MTTPGDHREPSDERPRHPTAQAAWLLVGVTVLLVVLAVLSST
ncbi:MAG: hypothetical protein U0Q07_16630 [Acidimicrobiales bacterium]